MSHWQELFDMRDEQNDKLAKSRIVVKASELPWEMNGMGRMSWYMHPNIEDTAMRTMMVYVQEIPPGSHSGKLQHQGGTAFYVWEGSTGYTIINGTRYDWEKDDVIMLPISSKGVVYQHFNTDTAQPARLLAACPNIFDAVGVDLGIGLKQLENCPEYRDQ